MSFNFLLWQLMHRTFGAVNKARTKELENYDITIRQSAVLGAVLRSTNTVTPTELSKELFLEHNSISAQIKRMEADGLIRKVKDLDRKNLVRIEVTEKGSRIYQKAKNRKSIEYIMSVLTEEEKLQLWSILVKLRGQAVKKLRIKNFELYPPVDPKNIQNL